MIDCLLRHWTGSSNKKREGLSCSSREAKALTKIVKEVFLEKKDPVQVARVTDHSPEAVGKYCQQFNKVKCGKGEG